jgi:hypothetical protein
VPNPERPTDPDSATPPSDPQSVAVPNRWAWPPLWALAGAAGVVAVGTGTVQYLLVRFWWLGTTDPPPAGTHIIGRSLYEVSPQRVARRSSSLQRQWCSRCCQPGQPG